MPTYEIGGTIRVSGKEYKVESLGLQNAIGVRIVGELEFLNLAFIESYSPPESKTWITPEMWKDIKRRYESLRIGSPSYNDVNAVLNEEYGEP